MIKVISNLILMFILGCGSSPHINNSASNTKSNKIEPKTNVGRFNEQLVKGAHFGDLNMINEALDRGADIHWKTDGLAAIHHAVLFENLEALRLLLSRGANPNQPEDEEHVVPLFYAVYKSNLHSTRILLEAGAKDSPVNKEFAALKVALTNQHYPMVKLLLEYGFNPNFQFSNGQGETPLIVSVISEDKELFDLLLKHGAEINTKDDNDYTALHLAVMTRNEHMIKQLLKAGAEISIQDFRARTAESMLVELGLSHLLEYKLQAE